MLSGIITMLIASGAILKDLDEVFSRKDKIEAQKAARIEMVRNSKTDEYTRLDNLFAEYYQYNIDSALFYANRKMSLAISEGISWQIEDACLDLAEQYSVSGMYLDALKLADSLPEETIGKSNKARLYHIYNAVYAGLGETSNDDNLKEPYTVIARKYRRLYEKEIEPDDIARLFIYTDRALEEGRITEALQPVLDHIKKTESIHEKAILHYFAANLYKKIGDKDNALVQYASSAICDLTTPVREYRALYELAIMLYHDGDIDRAYRYITRSIEDASLVNAKINLEYISQIIPFITTAYDMQIRKRHSEMLMYSAIITLIFILLAIASVACFVAMYKTREAKRSLDRRNMELNKVNEELVQSNTLKEFYIARYIDMCSDYIDGLDHFRNEMRKITQSGNITKVLNALKSKELIENELKALYASFDASFLDIYPDFVQKVNLLLRDDCQIGLNNAKSLTTELRVAALLRLGVTDSADIAHFLRRSVSTIYNCRVHLRNCARADRDQFEEKVMNIGRF